MKNALTRKKENVSSTLLPKKLVTAKAMTRTKIIKANSLHTVESKRRWASCCRMIDRFLNWGHHGKPNSGKITGRYQPPLVLGTIPGGEGGTQQRFTWGGPTPRFKPLPFYKPFLTEKEPLLYTFYWQMVSFNIIPSIELCIPLNCCKWTVF